MTCSYREAAPQHCLAQFAVSRLTQLTSNARFLDCLVGDFLLTWAQRARFFSR